MSSVTLPKLKLNDLINPTIASVVIGITFIVYLFAIGIPKTQARNLYNQAQLANSKGDVASAVNLLNQAYQVWPEAYIAAALADPSLLNEDTL